MGQRVCLRESRLRTSCKNLQLSTRHPTRSATASQDRSEWGRESVFDGWEEQRVCLSPPHGATPSCLAGPDSQRVCLRESRPRMPHQNIQLAAFETVPSTLCLQRSAFNDLPSTRCRERCTLDSLPSILALVQLANQVEVDIRSVLRSDVNVSKFDPRMCQPAQPMPEGS